MDYVAVSSKILNSSVAVTLYLNCYLDRILLLSNCIGPKDRALTGTIYSITSRIN